MAKFEAGNDPADHTVAEVNEFLKGDEVTGDEYDRVVQAEREGKNRVGIISGSGVEDVPDETGEQVDADDAGQLEDAAAEDEPEPDPAPVGNPLQMQPATPQETQTPAEALALAVERAQTLGRPTVTVDE